MTAPLSPAEQIAAEAIGGDFECTWHVGCDEECHADRARAVVAAVRPILLAEFRADLFEQSAELPGADEPSDEDPSACTVAKLATALDQLGGRIYRDFAGEYAEIDTSGDAKGTVARFNDFAEDSLAVLNDPEVRAVVEAALSRPTSEEH